MKPKRIGKQRGRRELNRASCIFPSRSSPIPPYHPEPRPAIGQSFAERLAGHLVYRFDRSRESPQHRRRRRRQRLDLKFWLPSRHRRSLIPYGLLAPLPYSRGHGGKVREMAPHRE